MRLPTFSMAPLKWWGLSFRFPYRLRGGYRVTRKHGVLSYLTGCAPQAVDNWSNFKTYKLRRPVGLIRADAHRSPFRESLAEVIVLCTQHASGATSFACSVLLPTHVPSTNQRQPVSALRYLQRRVPAVKYRAFMLEVCSWNTSDFVLFSAYVEQSRRSGGGCCGLRPALRRQSGRPQVSERPRAQDQGPDHPHLCHSPLLLR